MGHDGACHVGGVDGNFQKDLLGVAPAYFDFYYNQIAPAAIVAEVSTEPVGTLGLPHQS